MRPHGGAMNEPHDLGKTLEKMGTSADEVAATLRAADVQGVRNTVAGLNPIVQFIRNTLHLPKLEADVMSGKTLHINGVGGQEVALPRRSWISSMLSIGESTLTWKCRAAELVRLYLGVTNGKAVPVPRQARVLGQSWG